MKRGPNKPRATRSEVSAEEISILLEILVSLYASSQLVFASMLAHMSSSRPERPGRRVRPQTSTALTPSTQRAHSSLTWAYTAPQPLDHPYLETDTSSHKPPQKKRKFR